MAGIKAIAMVFGTLWLLFGLGLAWTSMKFKNDVQSEHVAGESESVSTSEEREERRRAARERWSEAEREYRRDREGVNIDSGSARPMVDVDPSHRY